MTREEGTDKVSLSVSNWLGLIVTVVIAVGTPILMLQARLTTVEVNQVNMQRQIDNESQRNNATRGEILGAIKDLRAELKTQ